MNSALKPILAQAGVPQPSGQSSPAKGNVAGVNHAGHPQGAQNSQPHPTNNLVGQNLVHHPPNNPQLLPHPTPHMAPVSADMAQMAQNMSHHGNLSHVSQNSVTPANTAASPNKSASTSAPLSLVADKPQPLALTRTPEKKEAESSGQANGSVESPKLAANAPSMAKPQNNDINKEKQEPAKTPSPQKPPEKAVNPPSTPQKTAENAVGQANEPSEAKVAAASEPAEKSPAKPAADPKPVPTADVAPAQNDNKTPETANDKSDKTPEKAAVPPKQDAVNTEKPKPEDLAKSKPEPKVEEPNQEKEKPAPVISEVKKDDAKPADTADGPKKSIKDDGEKPSENNAEEKKPAETSKPTKAEAKATKSTLKLATVTTPIRKRRQPSPTKAADGASPAKKAADGESTPDSRTKRNRQQVQLYQSPTPELTMATKLSASAGRSTPTKQTDDKLIVFYKNEYLAVRNADGGFYVCQALQNVYRTTRKIKIRWLSQDKTADPKGETYKPDFYDVTDMECVLTTLSLRKAPGGGGAQLLRAAEAARVRSILQRALNAESGGPEEITEEHPDGLDLSLFKDESQLEKKGKGKSAKSSPRGKADGDDSPTSAKSTATPKRSPRNARKAKATPKSQSKRKSPGSKPTVATPSKTAVSDKASPKTSKTPAKRSAKQANLTPAKSEPPAKTPSKGRRATRESKPSPIVPTPSTSTGKTTRTPRKPPAKK